MNKTKALARNLMGIGALTFIAFFLVFSERASTSALNGMKLCVYTLIPSLFPIMCLNSMLIESGIALKISGIIGRPVSKIFGIKKDYALPLFISALSSPPAGAASLCKLADQKDGEALAIPLLLSSSVSLGFTVGFLGNILKDPKRGAAVFFIQLISLLLSALLLNSKKTYPQTVIHRRAPQKKPSLILSDSLSDSLRSMIAICGSVVFFSALSGIFVSLPIPELFKAFLCSFLEITSGASFISSSFPPDTAFVWISMATGWTGLSMHCQVMAVKGDIPCSKYLLGKGLSAFISSLLALLLLRTGMI